MTDYKKYIYALRKCADEHDNDRTDTGNIRVSDLCRDTANLLERMGDYIPVYWLKNKRIKPFQETFRIDSNEYLPIVYEYDRIARERNQIIDEIISMWLSEQAVRSNNG